MNESDPLVDPAQAGVQTQWGVKIPLRDGVRLNATVYLPNNHTHPTPAVFTLTPYVSQTYHDRGIHFAARGFPFLTVDVRGRGNSEGSFRPFINEARDAFDVVEWLAQQRYCNGQVTMWGGSYGGYAQWAAAKEFPPHLSTIVPVASPYLGVDFPGRSNIPIPYLMQWLTLVWGRTSQDKLFWNNELYWGAQFRRWHESGAPFNQLDQQLGSPSEVFQEWIAHPRADTYWDEYNPTQHQYAEIALPILTITGIYDGDQPGALMHYRQHMRNAGTTARERHYLVIGPWDHAGTRAPASQFCGLKVGPTSLVDLTQLHLEWYEWTMRGGPKPQFLQDKVAYYVMGAERWRYAESLEAATHGTMTLYLHASSNPTDPFFSGLLSPVPSSTSQLATYVYDPRDVTLAALESTVDPESRVDQRMVHAACGKQLVYHSAPFDRDTEVCGFFSFRAWLSIDQPDTDFRVTVYEVALDGSAVVLATDSLRARYRKSLRQAELVTTTDPQRYDFERFTFVARLIRAGHRLRLVFGPVNSIYFQKNYNSGGEVAAESMRDARTVTVRLFHDAQHPSALCIPLGRPQT